MAALFICTQTSVTQTEALQQPLLQDSQPTATIVTIEVEEEEPLEEIFEAGSFDYYCHLIGQAATEHELNPTLAIAISRLETGNFKSKAFTDGYNFGGLTDASGVMSFENEDDGLSAFIDCLVWYGDNGMDTPDKMRGVYCPVNSNWAELVKQIMKEHE